MFDVYYDSKGLPIGTNASPTYVFGESVEDLKDQLLPMLEALQEPILNEADIGRENLSNPPFQPTPYGAAERKR